MIADAARNGLGKDYSSVTEGVVLVLTIVGVGVFPRLAFASLPPIRPILKPPDLRLIRIGRLEKNKSVQGNAVRRGAEIPTSRAGGREVRVRLCTL